MVLKLYLTKCEYRTPRFDVGICMVGVHLLRYLVVGKLLNGKETDYKQKITDSDLVQKL